MDRTRIKVINHSSHRQHDLHFLQFDFFYTCNGCGQRGFGPRFSCTHWGCSFNLHEECCGIGIVTPITLHPFLYGCNFTFSRSRPPQYHTCCNACRDIVNGPYYYCNNSRKNLHLSCYRLPRTITTSNGMQMELKNRYHVRCSYSMCREVNSGWSYSSPDDQYSYHVVCWQEQMLNNANHEAPRNGVPAFRNNVTRPFHF